MKQIAIQYYKTPVGEMILGAYDGKLCLSDWRYRKRRDSVDQRIQRFLSAEYQEQTDPVIDEMQNQLEAYFNGSLPRFDIPLLMAGTEFQQAVWQALLEIPFGQTETYQSLSEQMQMPKAIRAVANANGANGMSIIVPCHRIIGSDGSLTGYAGGLPAKKKLLQLEDAEAVREPTTADLFD